MVIRVRVAGQQQQAQEQGQQQAQEQEQEQEPPSAKRPRTSTSEDADGGYTDIKAHSLVLRTRSLYFDKGLSGDWAEAAEQRVELTVENEQAVEEVKLLIKLSYSDSYTRDDGRLLPVDVRMRLGVRADSLEFVEAVDEVVKSLPLELDFAGAVTCLEQLPMALETHRDMAAVRSQVVAALIKGIEERNGKTDEEAVALMQRGVNALAKYLGPVAQMFEETTDLSTMYLPLRKNVKQLPYCVFKRLLASEALQVQLENEVYTLGVAWLQQSSSVDPYSAVRDLAPLLRYHHMTPDFLANVVCRCPFINSSGLLPLVLQSALVHREVSPTLLEAQGVARGGRNRGVPPSEARWELKASFTLEELTALPPEQMHVDKGCGVVAGYSAALGVRYESATNSVGAYLHLCLPKSPQSLEGGAAAGVGLKVGMELAPDVTIDLVHFFKNSSRKCGSPDAFNKSWGEVVREDSLHFPGGKLEIKATVQLATATE
jgi:hypothetical protein